MTKTLFALTLCSAFALPALAHDDPAACVPTNSTTGENVYYTPAPVAKKAPARSHRWTDAERRQAWLREHTPSNPILGNMSGSAGRSTLSYLHGTDNPQSHMLLNSDVGSSARPADWNDRSTAYDTSEDEF